MAKNVLLLSFLLGVFAYANACSCMLRHPQEHYCSADFVILTRIKQDRTFNDAHFYKVRIRKEFKVSEKALTALKSGRLRTSLFGSMCGVDLQVGGLYVISGHVHSLKAYVNLCDMAEKWENLSRRQRKGLRMLYKHGCSCSIKNCKKPRCHRQINACNWTSDCEAKQGICLRQANKSCMWNRNRDLTTCLKQLHQNTTRIELKNQRRTYLNYV